MSHGRITRYVEEHHRITARHEAEVLEPEPVYEGWESFVSQRSVRAIAIAPQSRHMWLATWGGVLSWNRKEELLYRRYSSEHGLASNAVACICLDQSEQPWVGHDEGGLSFFDGHRWQVYKDEELLAQPVRQICCAGQKGGLWVATTDAVYHIPGPTGPTTPVAIARDGSVQALQALALLADGHDLLLGNAWGLFRLREGQPPEPLAPEEIRACTALVRDGEGQVWIGAPDAVYRLKEEEAAKPVLEMIAEAPGRVLALAAVRKRVWMLTTEGLGQVVDEGWQSVPRPEVAGDPLALRAIAASTDDAYLWVGTDRLLAGVHGAGEDARWDLDLLPPHPEDQISNLGRCVVSVGDDGRVWSGTAGGLVAFGPGDEWAAHLIGEDVRALAVNPAEQQTPWLLAWPLGVDRMLGPGQPSERVEQPPGLPLALAVGRDGAATAITGRSRWELGYGTPAELPGGGHIAARCLVQAADDVWWLGTTEGAYHLAGGRWALAGEQPGPGGAEVYGLAVLGDTLWAATETGLWARRADGWTRHGDGTEVRALAPAGGAGRLWLARGGGVERYDPASGAIEARYTPAESGLASRRVTALAENAGTLWIATQAGISRLRL